MARSGGWCTGLGVALLLVVALAWPRGAAADAIEVADAWIRLPPPGVPAAGYMVLVNRSDRDRSVREIRSEAAERVEMHRTQVEDGIARMEPVAQLELPAGAELELAPGGLHLMLLAPRPLREGEDVGLTLVFADGEELTLRARVRR